MQAQPLEFRPTDDEQFLRLGFRTFEHAQAIRECPSEDTAHADRLELNVLNRLITGYDEQYELDKVKATGRQ